MRTKLTKFRDRAGASLAPLLRDELHLSVQAYSNVVTAFMISFAVMYTVGGRLVDWLGERFGMSVGTDP